jgi:phosphoglycolate phosphatase
MEGRRLTGVGHVPGDWPRAILFDLDGTLIDSAADITRAVNELLASHNFPPLPVNRVKGMIGGGIRKLVERAFVASGARLADAMIEEANRGMASIYRRHLTHSTQLRLGAAETVAYCHGIGIRLGLVTNKPQVFAREILVYFGLAERFGAIVGGDAVGHLKPAPDGLLFALEQLGVEADEALVVGDSGADVTAARAAGMPVVLVRGGYTKVPVEALDADIICDSLLELPSVMKSLRKAA